MSSFFPYNLSPSQALGCFPSGTAPPHSVHKRVPPPPWSLPPSEYCPWPQWDCPTPRTAASPHAICPALELGLFINLLPVPSGPPRDVSPSGTARAHPPHRPLAGTGRGWRVPSTLVPPPTVASLPVHRSLDGVWGLGAHTQDLPSVPSAQQPTPRLWGESFPIKEFSFCD